MKKRTWAYIQQPNVHEIASCSCGNSNTQWSEYEKHLWCDKCGKDFIPKHNGIFDGPIAFNTAKMLGITFDRFNLLTNQVESVDESEVQSGLIHYLVCHNTKEVFARKKVEVDIKQYIYGNVFIKKGIFSFSNGSIHVELLEAMQECVENKFLLTMKFDYPDTKTFNIFLKIQDDLKTFNVINLENLYDFKQFMLVHELDNDLVENNLIKKVKKI